MLCTKLKITYFDVENLIFLMLLSNIRKFWSKEETTLKHESTTHTKKVKC